ncbi:MAG: hypothetical protein DWH91_15825 [Planctomycetota bacterium]|nr:MAG: hypothetical protein DWH91_15825 [Planctomycetota bacterium]
MDQELLKLYQCVDLVTSLFSILILGIGAMLILSHGRSSVARNMILAGLTLECAVVTAHFGFQIIQIVQPNRPLFDASGMMLIHMGLRVLGLGASLMLVAGILFLVRRHRMLQLLHEERNAEDGD